MLKDPQDGQVHFALMHTPFGSSTPVLHSNRDSWLLWALDGRLGLLWFVTVAITLCYARGT